MVRISVIAPTYRLGGLDVLASSLKNQSFSDFEFILVDCLYDFRRENIAKYMSKAGVKFRHLKPDPFKFPIDAVASCRNTGLRAAKGELILWWVDYTYAPPDCLEKHYQLFKEKGYCSMGVHLYWNLPKLHPTFRLNSETSFEEYVELVRASRQFDVSIFEEEFTPSTFQSLSRDEGWDVEPKFGLSDGPIGGDYFHAKNEAVPRSIHLKVGGFDEDFDGGHCYDDLEMGLRLQKASTLWLDKANVVYILNPRHLFAKARPIMLRSMEENYKIFTAKRG